MQVVESNAQFKLYVQLQKYYHEFNLKYIPEKDGTQYCCCADRDICFHSINASNLTYYSCVQQCKLRFTLCAGLANATLENEEGMSNSTYCYMSVIKPTPPSINFQFLSSNSYFFPTEMIYPHFYFSSEVNSPNVSRLNFLHSFAEVTLYIYLHTSQTIKTYLVWKCNYFIAILYYKNTFCIHDV